MLKIKDDMDLKELEKYGFKLDKYKNTYTHLIDGKWWDVRYVDVEDRCLSHITEEIGYWVFTDDDELLSITFDDLIKDGLVEEMEE